MNILKKRGCKTGRPRCDAQKLLKVILFAFMEHGFTSLRVIEPIFIEINTYIFDVDKVDLNHTYIDETKIEANANRYSWVLHGRT